MSRIPSDDLYNHVNCKYTGVVATAKRAREILKNADKEKESTIKPVLQAYDELMSGELNFIHVIPKNEEPEIETDENE
jgi:DNA-directed RNA polymerase omega subunit